jgi:hypothetical protein
MATDTTAHRSEMLHLESLLHFELRVIVPVRRGRRRIPSPVGRSGTSWSADGELREVTHDRSAHLGRPEMVNPSVAEWSPYEEDRR